MLRTVLIILAACVGILLGFLLGACWWWIKFQVRYILLRRMAAWKNRQADRIEEALERIHLAATNAEEFTTLLEAECRQEAPPRP
jgi:uncharacterized iron-regulated membrane protein